MKNAIMWALIVSLCIIEVLNTSSNLSLRKRVKDLEHDNEMTTKMMETQTAINVSMAKDSKIVHEWLKTLGDDSIDHTRQLRGR